MCWGANFNGQLGDGTFSSSSIVRPVSIAGTPTDMSLGPNFSCALVAGNAACWGASDGTTPVDASNGLVGLRGISRGNNHTCAIQSDHSVVCWGDNSFGQLGRGDTNPPASATEIIATGITDAEQIYAQAHSTCAVLTDGSVRCWGKNFSGWLGVNMGQVVVSPAPVAGLGGVAQLSFRSTTDETGICARKSDGTVACWGANNFGQVGDGTFAQRNNAVLVGGLTGVVDLAAGTNHTCAAKEDGTVACWGSAVSGQLGDGVRASPSPANARMTCP